ncbi:unnamed protein product [Closterium sp. NIES-54]
MLQHNLSPSMPICPTEWMRSALTSFPLHRGLRCGMRGSLSVVGFALHYNPSQHSPSTTPVCPNEWMRSAQTSCLLHSGSSAWPLQPRPGLAHRVDVLCADFLSLAPRLKVRHERICEVPYGLHHNPSQRSRSTALTRSAILRHADVVFLSPPWGGPEYLDQSEYDIWTMLQPVSAHVSSLTAFFSPYSSVPAVLHP